MSKTAILNCHRAISDYINYTPVHTSQALNDITSAEIYFKCENFQKTGSFKIRGATNIVLHLTDEQKKVGIVAHSSGNFAQALALAAKKMDVKCYLIMPNNVTQVKKDAAADYGAEIIECEPTQQSREITAKLVSERTRASFIHPSNNMDVIIGQGTATLELLNEFPDINSIIAPIGGGGLIAGTALAARYFGKDCKVYGGEPKESDDAYRSMISGRIEVNSSTNTIADGLRTMLGDINFPIIRENVEKIIRVTEEDIIYAMKFIWERMKLIIEPSSAVAVAALLKEKSEFKSQKVGIIISGGNVDLANLPF